MGARSSQSRGPGLNETDGHLLEYFRNTFSGGGGGTNAPPVINSGLTATGGIISDYTSGPAVYRAHIFTSSGALNVTALGDFGDTVEYLVVAGGGGGAGLSGYNGGGGGGAGGLRTNLTGHPLAGAAFPVGVSPYPVVVGAGGAFKSDGPAPKGIDSVFGSITSSGGGGGGYPAGTTGGSGGGGSAPTSSNVAGNTPPSSPPQGNPGGHGNSNNSKAGGGGGGAGGAGENASGSFPGGIAGNGGLAVQVLIAGPPASTQPIGTPGPSGTGWFAGGGGGAGADETFADTKRGVGGRGPDHSATTPYGGGGNGQPGGASAAPQPQGLYSTGGGGGGGRSPNLGGSGGSGIVVVRYQIGELTATQKATGGSISFYNGKTIHTFTNSGDFTVTDGSAVAISYVAVAGGGGGAGKFNEAGGGGGAGGVMTNIPGFMPVTQSAVNISPGAPNKVTVTVGGGGVSPQQTPGIGAQGSNTTLVCSPSSLNITATGGGFGGISYHPGDNPLQNGGAGGSGGGGAEAAGSAGAASPAGQGNAGGTGSGTAGSTENSGGGGGGAGGVGSNAPDNANGGAGGVGKQLPAIFQNPASATSLGTPGPSGTYWIAGGGGGGTTTPGPSGGAGGAGGAGGGGAGGTEPGPSGGSNGLTNTGGGGGSSEGTSGSIGGGFAGGSGIVLIAYPS